MMKQGIMSLQEGGPTEDRIAALKKQLRTIMARYREQQRLSEQISNPLHEGQHLTSSGNFITDLSPKGLTGQGNKWSALDDADYLNAIDWQGINSIEELLDNNVSIYEIEDFVNRGILTSPAEAASARISTDPETNRILMETGDDFVDWGDGVYDMEGKPLTAADWASSSNLTADDFADDLKRMGPRLRKIMEADPSGFQAMLDIIAESDDFGSEMDYMLYGEASQLDIRPKSIVGLHDEPGNFWDNAYRDMNTWADGMPDEEFAMHTQRIDTPLPSPSPHNIELRKALDEIKLEMDVPSAGSSLTGPGWGRGLGSKLNSMIPWSAIGKSIPWSAAAGALSPLDALEIAVMPTGGELGNPEEYLGNYDSPHADLSRFHEASSQAAYDKLGPNTGDMDLVRSLSPTTYDSNIEDLMEALYESQRKQRKPGTPMLDVLRRR